MLKPALSLFLTAGIGCLNLLVFLFYRSWTGGSVLDYVLSPGGGLLTLFGFHVVVLSLVRIFAPPTLSQRQTERRRRKRRLCFEHEASMTRKVKEGSFRPPSVPAHRRARGSE